MFIRRSIVFALLAAGAALGPAASAARFDVDVYTSPPAPIYEPVPAPRAGYVWAPGYWEWRANEHRHHWHHGYWVRARHGYAWAPHRWEEHNGRWHMEGGHWERAG